MDGPLALLALTVTRGEDRTFQGTHQTSATNTAAINITGWTMTFTARTTKGAILFTKAISIVVAGAGTYSFTVSASDTTVTPGTYSCDIWRIDSGVATIMGLGTLTITPDVRV